MEDIKKTCPFCGFEADADCEVCPICGASLKEAASEEAEKEVVPETEEPVSETVEESVPDWDLPEVGSDFHNEADDPLVDYTEIAENKKAPRSSIPAYQPKEYRRDAVSDTAGDAADINEPVRGSLNRSGEKDNTKLILIIAAAVLVGVLCACCFIGVLAVKMLGL